MSFGFLSGHSQPEGKQLLTARIKSQDGSVVRARVANVRLTFKTAFGNTRLDLSRIRSLEDVSHLATLKNIAKLHRFHIFCVDGNELFGVPLSSERLPVAVAGATRSWNFMRLIDILSLEVLPREPVLAPEHTLN